MVTDRGATVHLTPWVVLTGLLLAPVLVLVGWWTVSSAANRTAGAAAVEPVVAPVTRQDLRAEAAVTVEVGEAPGRQVTLAAAGTVTAPPSVGATLDAGTEVLRVDDRPVRAMVSSAPPWRPLAPGDVGADVTRLQEYLTVLGHYDGPADGRFGAALRRAVERFNVEAGLGTGVGTFDPAVVVWVGPSPLVVQEVIVETGATVAPGTPVLRGPARASVVAVTEPTGGVAGVGEFGAAAALVVGSVEVPYVPGSGAVEVPDHVAAVASALAPSTEGAARVRAVEARPVVVVPASALVQGADGTVCVYAAADAQPRSVSPVGGGVGSAQLPADLPLDEVLANPGRVDLAYPCGSS
ncbi:peptidoglycan-binding domain-containing protein [Cellulomonas phragmiteti]|uniref:Peptidoglycan binding-like domain-containing protein n=1 Tax=Cellulomonas phragmiteti TaxID=478780 RepID=A0ABQ4DPR7_9CELL|nr:peptidoglycan-binding protein [Cellulomonas phragmiteti]GIG41348.1 hypothetical protein Cph01nite_31100 [Cellulomonas phragmiteti]